MCTTYRPRRPGWICGRGSRSYDRHDGSRCRRGDGYRDGNGRSGSETSAEATETATEEATAEAAATATPVVPPVASGEWEGMQVGFTAEGYPFRGEPNAPITMYEYSDYQCPFCARYFVQTEPAINDNYVRTGKVRVVFRDFPIEELHPNAPAAHRSILCVAEQGADLYWAMHSKLFQTQTEWSNSSDPQPVFERLADEAGADMDAYKQCMTTAETEKQPIIDAGLAAGQQAGVTGTPSFVFVGPDGVSYPLVGAAAVRPVRTLHRFDVEGREAARA